MGLFWRRKKDEFVSLRLNEPAEVKPAAVESTKTEPEPPAEVVEPPA